MSPIDAEYRDGILRPSQPLPLRPGERVGIIVIRHPDPARWDLARLARGAREDAELAEMGLADWSRNLDSEDNG